MEKRKLDSGELKVAARSHGFWSRQRHCTRVDPRWIPVGRNTFADSGSRPITAALPKIPGLPVISRANSMPLN